MLLPVTVLAVTTVQRQLPDRPSIKNHWKAIKWQWRQLEELGDYGHEHLVALYDLVDMLPLDEDRWVAARLKLPEDEAANLQRSAYWHGKDSWRRRLPKWRRWIFPLGPSRRTRRSLWYRRGYWDEEERCFSLK
jgi:hypothetical protein